MTARASQRPSIYAVAVLKQFYGEPQSDLSHGTMLDVAPFTGIVSYEPTELVLTARAGTPLTEIEDALASNRQMLAFEPPRFGEASTIGGCVAAGLSGPRRMHAGPLRDFVLGTTLLDASGTVLRFGGEVMKNVAGYDISRLLTGSLGIFGPILEVSIKVAPKPLLEETLVLEVDEAEALIRFNAWRNQPIPISASAWESHGGIGLLRLRISGKRDTALRSARRRKSAVSGSKKSRPTPTGIACATKLIRISKRLRFGGWPYHQPRRL